METREHPLRRRYGMELVLGGLVAFAAIVVFVAGERRAGSPRARETARADEPAGSEPEFAAAPLEETRRAVAASSARAGTPPPAVCPPGSFAVDVVDERGKPLADVTVLLLARDAAAPDDRSRERGVVSRTSDAGGQAFFDLALVAEARERVAPEGVQLVHRLTVPTNLTGTPHVDLPAGIASGQRFRLELPDGIARLFGTLDVRVIDGNGSPVAGVPVAWNAWAVDRPREFLHGGIGRTRAEDGVAELSLEALRTLRWRERNSGGSHRFRAEVVLPFVGGAPSADLGDDPTRDGPVTLVLPDTGTVEVHVECADGTPAGDGVRVRAWGWPPGGEDEALLDVAVVGGRAMLALVGLGLELRLSAGPEDHSRATAWTEILGPTYPGERVKAQLRLGPEATRVRLLAVDELGAPIPRAVLSGTVRVREPGSEHDTQFRFDADTDEAGGAAFRLDGFPAGQRESSLRIETSCTSEAKALHRLQAELPSPALRAGRENELGTIVLRGPPPSHPGIVLATGTVVDDATGAPLASARVNLSGDYLDDESAWIRSVDTGIDGGFELRGPPGLANLQLQAFAREHEPAGSPVVSGGNVLLRLKREVRFEARVLLEPELPRRYLQFLLISEHLSVEGEIHDLERVRFRPPEPGEYSFEVRTSDGAWLVERIEGIRVGAPETHPFAPATDPRLDPLDLRGRIVLALFRLRAAGGQALAGRVVRVRIDAGEPMRVRTDEDGRLVLVVPARARLELEPEGFQPLVCAPDREERTLDFSPR